MTASPALPEGAVMTTMGYFTEPAGGYSSTADRISMRSLKNVPIHVHDARRGVAENSTKSAGPVGSRLKLDIHSFELIDQETKFGTEDFYAMAHSGAFDGNALSVAAAEPTSGGKAMGAKLLREYQREMMTVLKAKTGATAVVPFNFQVRNKEKAIAAPGTAASVQSYAAGAAHTDSSAYHASGHLLSLTVTRLRSMIREADRWRSPAADCEQDLPLDQSLAGRTAEDMCKGRLVFMGVWRNISDTPIVNDSLCVLDETSLAKPEDMLARDSWIEEGLLVCHYGLDSRNAERHKWYFYPEMKKNELLVFKHWDSDFENSGRVCFHGAFHVDGIEGPPRESMEMRLVLLFPDHDGPNTFPLLAKVEDINAESQQDINAESQQEEAEAAKLSSSVS